MKSSNKVPISECYRLKGKAPISVRWIDVNKGDVTTPNYSSRHVARDINIRKREDLFAATPPLEALEMTLPMTATSNKGEAIMINDVSRAFFHAKAKRPVFVQLAEEDRVAGQEHMCGRLNFSMHETSDAAQNWYE